MANHIGLHLDGRENLAIVHANNGANHIRQDQHIAALRLDDVRLVVGTEALARLVQLRQRRGAALREPEATLQATQQATLQATLQQASAGWRAGLWQRQNDRALPGSRACPHLLFEHLALSGDAPLQPPARARVDELHQLLLRQVNQVVQVDAAV